VQVRNLSPQKKDYGPQARSRQEIANESRTIAEMRDGLFSAKQSWERKFENTTGGLGEEFGHNFDNAIHCSVCWHLPPHPKITKLKTSHGPENRSDSVSLETKFTGMSNVRRQYLLHSKGSH
jgi:hypothetical protein